MRYPFKKLIVFDYDGTLVKAFTHKPLHGVREWFMQNRDNYMLATVNNFGGVGLRLWMEVDGWGEPEKYPTEDETYTRVTNSLELMGLSVANSDIRNYMCFVYKSRNGNYSPRPAGKEQAMEWQLENRKPSPGLLLQVMKDAGVTPAETLYVGDDWNNEDSMFAHNAGVQFINSREFFYGVESE